MTTAAGGLVHSCEISVNTSKRDKANENQVCEEIEQSRSSVLLFFVGCYIVYDHDCDYAYVFYYDYDHEYYYD